jgi:hypothetical protein
MQYFGSLDSDKQQKPELKGLLLILSLFMGVKPPHVLLIEE